MNQILVATIIAVSIIGAGAYAASQVSEVSTASSRSSDIDIEKKSENMNVSFNGTFNIINTGKDPSEIAMFRFYDSSGNKVHQVMIPDEDGRTFGANPQVSNKLLTLGDEHLPRHTLQSFSVDEMGINSFEDITGEMVTKRGGIFPISFDERTNQNGDGTDDGIIEAVEEFLDEWTNQNGVGTGDGTGNVIIEAVDEFLEELKTNQNGVGTGVGTIEAIEEFLDEWTNQNGDGTGVDTIEAIEEFLEELKTNQNGVGTGDGKTLTDGLGVYLAIQNINTNGKVYFGSGNNPGSQTDIRQYVGVENNDDWAIAITDDERVASTPMRVPEFGKEYRYDDNSLEDDTQYTRNELWYYENKIMSGSPNAYQNDDGITISGTGTMVMKLDFWYDGLLIRGTLNNADVKIVTSPLDLTTLSMSGNSYTIEQTTPSKVSTGTWIHCHWIGHCSGQYGPVQNTHIHQLWDMVSSLNLVVAQETVFAGSYHTTQSCFGYRNACHSLPYPSGGHYSSGNHGHTIFHSETSTFTTSNVPDGIKITKQITTGNMKSYSTPIHRITSAAPWNGEYSFDSNFEQYVELSNDSYIVVNLNDGNVVIKGENFDPDSDVFFQVDGLPSDVAYDITKNGITGVIGKTSHIGEISLSYDDVDFGISTSPGGILKIYPDSAKYLGSIDNVAMIDLYNGYSIPLDTGTNLVYIPQAFVRLVFPVAVEVENVLVDNIPLDDLNTNYAKNEALMIPVIPGGEIIYATINGEDVEVLMRYVSAPTQMKQVPQKSSISSDHSTSGVASTSSNISTSTFLTATHDGMMGVNLDLKVGGSADYTMDSEYTGEFTKRKSCKWYGASSPYRTYSCNTHTSPSSPNSISNIDSLTSAHRAQLVESLTNGQASNLTVEVDIFRNMQYVDTILIYRSDSAQASITSTLRDAGYGASNQVHITYPLTSISDNVATPVTVGDMMEFVVRVNLQASGAPTSSNVNESYSSYVQVETKFGGGVITIGMF